MTGRLHGPSGFGSGIGRATHSRLFDDPDPIFHLPGLFWLVRIDDENLQHDGEESGTALLKIRNLLEFDRFQAMGHGNEATHLSFDTTYRVVPGKPTTIVPLTNDPMSPNNWAANDANRSNGPSHQRLLLMR